LVQAKAGASVPAFAFSVFNGQKHSSKILPPKCGLTGGRKTGLLLEGIRMNPPKPSLDELRIDRSRAPQSRNGFKTLAGVLFVLLVTGSVVWWIFHPRALEVHTALAQEIQSNKPIERTVLNASGYVTARRASTVSSKVTGKVTEVLIEEGMKVGEGQVLARLDDTNVKASLLLAEAQLESARRALAETRARLKEAELTLQRTIDLAKSKISAVADLDHAEADQKALASKLEAQQADITVAERQVAAWQQQMEDMVIRAPFPGIVTSKNAQPGEMISPMSAGGFTRTGICTIVDMQSLEIEIEVNESYINRVEPGQPVEATLDAYSDWKIPCKVIAIIPTADRQKSTVKVRVGFEKLDPRILPEMSVKVAFHETAVAGPSGTRSATVRIPKTALQQEDGKDIVMVVQDGRAERREVIVSQANGDELVVGSGVKAGERVVVDAPKGLTSGAKVRDGGH
jgi:RND family efflux transporter MFP subunit